MKSRYFFLFLLACLSFNLTAQEQNKAQQLPSYIRQYMDFSRGYTQEKVYLHFDNSNYFIGENIWFKAYVLFAENHNYTTMSKTLYVELLSQDGNLVNTLKLKIENGQAHGVFYLKEDMNAGFYEIRAYTRCMLNFGPEVVFSRVLPVMDPPVYHKRSGETQLPTMTWKRPILPAKRPELKNPKKIQIDFFPEGGHLLENVTNNLAFKAHLPDDEEITLTGSINDSHDQIVSVFSVMHNGMGVFEFTPQTGESYTCHYQYQDKTFECPLPAIEKSGYALKVNNLHQLETDVYVLPANITQTDTLAMAISCRGKIYAYKAFVITPQSGVVYSFAKEALPSGVNQITLYNASGHILAERMIFVKNPRFDPQKVFIEYAQDRPSYEPFKPIRLKFNVREQKDSIKIPLACTFSLSVKDAGNKIYVSDRHGLYSELLLASDLKGYIHQPDYYFEKEDARHQRALDLLMMIQGWRRYDWETMTGQKEFTLRHPIEEGILLQGQVLSIIRRRPQQDIKVTMWMTSDSSAYYGSCQTDSNGVFDFLFDFEEQWKLSLQITDGKKRKNFYMTIDRQFSPPAKNLSYYETLPPVYRAEDKNKGELYTNNDIDRSDIKIMPGDVLLPEAEVKGKRKSSTVPGEISITYNAQEQLDILEDMAESTYSEVIIFLTQINPNFYLRYDTSGKEVLYYKSAPVVLYDMRLDRPIAADSEDMPIVDQIEKFEIIEPNSPNAAFRDLEISVIDVTQPVKNVAYVLMYRYADGHREIDPVGIRHTVLQGYNKVKDFYHPHYDKILLPDEDDHRRTLYWNPDVKTDSTGTAEIRFYNNSSGTQILPEAEIITSDGKIGSLR